MFGLFIGPKKSEQPPSGGDLRQDADESPQSIESDNGNEIFEQTMALLGLPSCMSQAARNGMTHGIPLQGKGKKLE